MSVLVIASGDKQREATEAGADYVGGDDMVAKIQNENLTDFDAGIATPDMMRGVGRSWEKCWARALDAESQDRHGDQRGHRPCG